MTEARFVMNPSQQDPPAPLSRRALRDAERAREQAAQQPPAVPQPNPFEQTAAAQHPDTNSPTSRRRAAATSPSPRKRVVVVVRQPAEDAQASSPNACSPLVAMLFAGAMIVGVSIPANAFVTERARPTRARRRSLANAQSVVVSARGAGAPTPTAPATPSRPTPRCCARSTATAASPTRSARAPCSGRSPMPCRSPTASVSASRPAVAARRSTTGVDFVPGAGMPIYAIADGVVVEHEDNDRNSFGNHVLIEHVINGKTVQSLYGHMQLGSSPLSVGDTVAVGDFVGLVGDTGAATAPHLHLEIHLDGRAGRPLRLAQGQRGQVASCEQLLAQDPDRRVARQLGRRDRSAAQDDVATRQRNATVDPVFATTMTAPLRSATTSSRYPASHSTAPSPSACSDAKAKREPVELEGAARDADLGVAGEAAPVARLRQPALARPEAVGRRVGLPRDRHAASVAPVLLAVGAEPGRVLAGRRRAGR